MFARQLRRTELGSLHTSHNEYRKTYKAKGVNAVVTVPKRSTLDPSDISTPYLHRHEYNWLVNRHAPLDENCRMWYKKRQICQAQWKEGVNNIHVGSNSGSDAALQNGDFSMWSTIVAHYNA